MKALLHHPDKYPQRMPSVVSVPFQAASELVRDILTAAGKKKWEFIFYSATATPGGYVAAERELLYCISMD